MRKKQYDVIVVGCGPGGAVAGKFAALNGAETLIIEQKRQIGFPVHDNMGIIYSKSEMEEITGEQIDAVTIYARAGGLRYISPSGKEGKPQLLPDGLFINRQLFEKSLAIGAVRAGAEIMLHTRVVGLVRDSGRTKGVIIETGSGYMPIPCSVVIAADGNYQHISRLAGFEPPNRKISVSIGCEFVGVKSLRQPHSIDEIYLDPYEGTYRFAAPYSEDRLTVGCSTPRGILKQKKNLKQRLDDMIRHLETIEKYDFTKASAVSIMTATQATTGLGIPPRLASDGIIPVGDAIVGEPLFGSRWGGAGMFRACWTGRKAGKIAANAIRKGDVSGKSLDAECRCALIETLQEEERERILEAFGAWGKILSSNLEEQEQAIEEVGWEVAALHFHCRGGLAAPLPSCLGSTQKWLKERERG